MFGRAHAEGFLRLRFGVLIFGSAYFWKGLLSNFLVFDLYAQCKSVDMMSPTQVCLVTDSVTKPEKHSSA